MPKVHIELNNETAPLIPRDLALWCNYASGGVWQPYPHCRIICENLMRIFDPEDDLKRLIIEMPPRHSKTYTTAKLAACFYLGWFPNHEVQVITHTAKYSEKIGHDARNIFNQYANPIFGHTVSTSSAAKDHWRVAGHTGGINATGIGGNVLGQGAHLLIVDDPYSNLAEGLSEAKREDVWELFTGTLRSRLYSNSGIVVIHQRVHTDDLIGRLKREDPSYKVLTFKAIADEDEYLEDGSLFRRAGEALAPDLIDLDLLLEHKATMDRFQWECHYQQNPILPEGIWWGECFPDGDVSCFVDHWPDDLDRLTVAIDPSMGKGSKDGDYQAIVALGTRKDGLFYVNASMEKTSVERLCSNAASWMSQALPKTPDAVGVEDEAAQELMIKPLTEALAERGLWTGVHPMPTGKIAKKNRIARLGPWVEKHRIRFVRSPGTRILVDQLKHFPTKGVHDDGPDALEMAFRLLWETATRR